MKIMHIGDIHARDMDIDEVEKCLRFMVQKAKEDRPHIILNTGDTFDNRDVKLDSKSSKLIFKIFSDFAMIAPVATIIGTSLHDGYASEVLSYINAEYPVFVATYPRQIYLYQDGMIETGVFNRAAPLEAVISLVPAPTKQFFKSKSDIKGADSEIAQAMNSILAGFGAQYAEIFQQGYEVPHIGVGHWNITGSLISETQTLTGVDIEISKDQMALAECDLWCMGHIHLFQWIAPNIYFCGSMYRKDYGEMEEKGFYIHNLSDDFDTDISPNRPINSQFIRTPTRKLAKLEFNMTTEGAFDELDAILYGFEPNEIKNSLLRVNVKVFQDEAVKIDKKQIENFYMSAGAKSVEVFLSRVPRENVRSKSILKLKDLPEKIIENARLKGETVPESILQKAKMLESMTHEEIIEQIMKGEISEKSNIEA